LEQQGAPQLVSVQQAALAAERQPAVLLANAAAQPPESAQQAALEP